MPAARAARDRLSCATVARCFVTRRLPGPALDLLETTHEVEVWPGRLPPTPAELAAGAADAEGLLALLSDRVDAALIDACPRLRAISNYAVGVDNVDLDAATRRGIPVGHTPDVLTDATADLAFTLLLAAARKLPEAIRSAQAGNWVTWEPAMYLGQAVHGTTLGIIGFGRIGRAVARRAEGFEMRVLHASAREPRELEPLLTESDFVSLHCPLTPDTHHLIGSRALELMQPNAILINTARGGIVDQAALRDALERGVIAGAALDVTDPEPLPPEDPLLGVPNLIITPHIGSATRVARERMAEVAVENLLAGLADGTMPHQAN
jgi:lactate dehydrogenase-like 2-hydroxyacid dehydrogenase